MRNYPRWSRWRSCGDNKTTSQPARELLDAVWEAAERGPYPLIHADAFNVLGQIELDEGKKDAAIEAAKKAYRLAWCDGPPFAYHWGLEKAKQHLKELRSIRGMSFMWMRNRLTD